MSVYARFKRDPGGFRALVELLESTPASRRQRMIEVGMTEDAEYTQKALSFAFNFEDILKLPDEELAEVVSASPARIVASAIHQADEATKARFLRCARPQQIADLRDYLDTPNVGLREIGGAQLKMVTITRSLERKGLVRTKRLPTSG